MRPWLCPHWDPPCLNTDTLTADARPEASSYAGRGAKAQNTDWRARGARQTADTISGLKLGNGTSILITANIASALPTSVGAALQQAADKDSSALPIYALAFFVTTLGVVYVQEARRRPGPALCRAALHHDRAAPARPLRACRGGGSEWAVGGRGRHHDGGPAERTHWAFPQVCLPTPSANPLRGAAGGAQDPHELRRPLPQQRAGAPVVPALQGQRDGRHAGHLLVHAAVAADGPVALRARAGARCRRAGPHRPALPAGAPPGPGLLRAARAARRPAGASWARARASGRPTWR
jgi:hypothetical protein